MRIETGPRGPSRPPHYAGKRRAVHPYRTHTCGELRAADAGAPARLSGWVHRRRDHGNLLFVDLRDHYGLTQCVIETSAPGFREVAALRLETVVRVTGRVERRSDETRNETLATGEVELRIDACEVLGPSAPLPLEVNSDRDYGEEVRLRHRFLDLRRDRVHRNIMLRCNVIASVRRRMAGMGFTEFQTPILASGSPEGARDFLVPSRLHPGRFYALPQAPQQFKQLVMVAGFDRYFQIAPCFRDEDARADRSPGEFYQLDIEMSFATEDDVFDVVETLLHGVFEEFADGRGVSPRPFPRIGYADAMARYGTDKPDLRNPVEMRDVTDVFRGSDFRVFAGMIAADEEVRVRALPAPGGGSRAFCDRMDAWAREEGQPGLGYAFYRDGGAAGPIARNLGEERLALLAAALQEPPGDGDAVFFVCGRPGESAAFAARARDELGARLGLVDRDRFAFCWIVDYPMYERDGATGRIGFSHNPFSMPQGGLEALETADPLEILAHQYDIVCNGVELSSGAIRNHRPDVMRRAFEIAGYSGEEVEAEFGGMLAALGFGAPPHGGSAPGLDRIVMLLADESNIREVTLFPMNQQAEDLMMNAPAPVPGERLRELSIRLDLPE